MCQQNHLHQRQAFAAPRGLRCTPSHRLVEQLLHQFVEENRAIEHYICADKGVDLMAIDGRITTRIIDHFTRKNVPILTVHDSYVIQSEHEAALMKQMEYATEVEIGDF